MLIEVIIVCFLIPVVGLAQEPNNEQALSSLSLIQGKVSLKNSGSKEYITLVSSVGRQYALTGKIAEEKIRHLQDLETKKLTLVVNELPSQLEITGSQDIYDSNGNYLGKRRGVFKYKLVEVVSIERIEDSKGAAEDFSAVMSEESPAAIASRQILSQALTQPTLHIYNIKGRVISCNLGIKSVIPTLEVEYKSGKEKYRLNLIINQDTQIIKVVDAIPMEVMPRAINAGSRLNIWFQQIGDQNFARIISILD